MEESPVPAPGDGKPGPLTKARVGREVARHRQAWMRSDEFPVGMVRALGRPRSRRALRFLLQLFGVLAASWLLVHLAAVHLVRARANSPVPNARLCASQIKNIAVGLGMWAEDHHGRYPDRLQQLVPDYLRRIPECPAAGRDTYSSGYQVSASPARCTVVCVGHHHAAEDLPPNQPGYDSQTGLEVHYERPGYYRSARSEVYLWAGLILGAVLAVGTGLSALVARWRGRGRARARP